MIKFKGEELCLIRVKDSEDIGCKRCILPDKKLTTCPMVDSHVDYEAFKKALDEAGENDCTTSNGKTRGYFIRINKRRKLNITNHEDKKTSI